MFKVWYKTVSLNPLFSQGRNLSYNGLKNWYASLVKPKPRDPPYGHITQIGDPVLRVVSDKIPTHLVTSEEIKFLIKCMRRVFKNFDSVGLSAPQIGVPFRIFMFGVSEKQASRYSAEERNAREIDVFPFTVVINPEVQVTDFTKLLFPEGCLSVRGYNADVPRFRSVEVKGLDENGKSIQFTASGWAARIVQHEMDHLNGKLYTDIMDRNTFTCICWQTVNEQNGKVALPFSAD